jgi:hypothetical protein
MILCLAFQSIFVNALTTRRTPIGDFISPDAFRSIADFIYEDWDAQTAATIPKLPTLEQQTKKILTKLSPGDIIYVYLPCLNHFIKHVHPKIAHPYIMICSSDDHPTFDESYLSYINDPKVINCYVRNINIDHPKVQPIPIGIGNTFWDLHYHKRDITIILDVIKINPPRNRFVYMNISTGTFPTERGNVLHLFNQLPFVTVANGVSFKDYLTELKKHFFCISPAGNGVECHRTWEAMYMGSIPIIRPMTKIPTPQPAVGYEKLYHDLPAIMVSNWEIVTEDFLNQKLEEFKNREFNMDKLYFPYWRNLIKKESSDYKANNIN